MARSSVQTSRADQRFVTRKVAGIEPAQEVDIQSGSCP